MEESAINIFCTLGIQSLDLNGSDAAIQESRKFGCARICVEGYDTLLPRDDVDAALRKHFASCGEIAHVSIRRYAESKSTLNRYAMIYILGEGAEEKALELSGRDVGGWTVFACAELHPKVLSDDELAAERAKDRYEATRSPIGVRGYDTSLPADDIKSALTVHFALCGDITEVYIYKSCAVVCIMGEGAQEKALALDGSEMGGCTLVVEAAYKPNKNKRPRKRKCFGSRFAVEAIKVRHAELAMILKNPNTTTKFHTLD